MSVRMTGGGQIYWQPFRTTSSQWYQRRGWFVFTFVWQWQPRRSVDVMLRATVQCTNRSKFLESCGKYDMIYTARMFYLAPETAAGNCFTVSFVTALCIYTQTSYWENAIRTAVTLIFIANPAMAVIPVNNHEIAYFIFSRWYKGVQFFSVWFTADGG